MPKEAQKSERRTARRFGFTWDVTICGVDHSGGTFCERGTLENLSSRGAFLCLNRLVGPGDRLELEIRVPFNKNKWMKYGAEVVRLKRSNAHRGIGVIFDTAVPGFVTR